MSHEVIQQVKRVKYNIKSHKITRIKHSNGKEENGKRTNTHNTIKEKIKEEKHSQQN